MADANAKKTLVEKLGMRPFMRAAVVGAYENYIDTLGKLPNGIIIEGNLQGKYRLIQYFTPWREDLEKDFPRLKKHLFPVGALWISWPKKKSGLISNINENIIREVGLKNRMVDVKVVEVDKNWSGLKFMFRLKDRDKIK